MPNVKNNATAQETQRRLIDEAGNVFARRGLHAATIKEITDLAGVNTAAINYHFSDKFALYAEVIRYALSRTPVVASEAELTGTPEQRLRAFIADIVKDLYNPARPPWQTAVLTHEFAQPTAALDGVMEELIRPRSDRLNTIVRQIMGNDVSERQVLSAGLSIAAQCFFYLYQSEVLRRLYPGEFNRDLGDELVDHITDFSLAALHGLRKRRKRT